MTDPKPTAHADPSGTDLQRTLGLSDVVLLGISSIIGSGIFLLPGLAVAQMGPAALAPLLIAGVLCVLIALCFAEIGGRFSTTGGAYLFAREAYGGFVGFSVGWMSWWIRIIAWAALANGFALALHPIVGDVPAYFDPLVACAVIVGLSAINWRGSRAGTIVTNVVTIAKLVPMVLFVTVGVFFIDGERFTPFAPNEYRSVADTTLLLLWAFVGFESIAIPAGEMRDPQRTVPRAIVIVMTVVTLLYFSIFSVAIGTYDGIAGSENPVAEAAGVFLGPVGATLIAVGIAVSIFGTNSVSALVAPRCVYALAERDQAPPVFGWVHADHRTPTIAILATAAIAIALALTGTFEELAVISVVARFFQYLPTCTAVLVFRSRDTAQDDAVQRFRLPLGPTIPVLATALCVALLVQTEPDRLLKGTAAFVLGIPFYSAFGRGRIQA